MGYSVKNLKNSVIDKNTPVKLLQNGTCMDCIFWYQCRQGKVDCQVKQK